MKKVLFIEFRYSSERHFIHGFRAGAIRSGWKPAFVWLCDESNHRKSPEQITREIEEQAPDLIMWVSDCVLPFAECLEGGPVRNIPKVSLWFDDYMRTFALPLCPEKHQRLVKECSLKTYVWDGFWRKKFQERFNIFSYPIHLGADEIECFPSEPTHFKGFEDSLIFVGNTPSFDSIKKEASLMPLPCSQIILLTQEIIARSPYGRLPYEAYDEAFHSLSAKGKTAVTHFRRDIAQNILINRLVWMLGKREVRIRILRLAAQQRQVVILSGHSDKFFADAAEFGRDIGQSRHPLKFINTAHVKLDELGCLYHIGGLHLQATDPQSVEGGIPFRVFETSASGRPLLSDFKPELGDCFKSDLEMLYYQNDQDFSDKLQEALKNPARLKEIGEAACQRFLKEHTWTHRFRHVVEMADKPPQTA